MFIISWLHTHQVNLKFTTHVEILPGYHCLLAQKITWKYNTDYKVDKCILGSGIVKCLLFASIMIDNLQRNVAQLWSTSSWGRYDKVLSMFFFEFEAWLHAFVYSTFTVCASVAFRSFICAHHGVWRRPDDHFLHWHVAVIIFSFIILVVNCLSSFLCSDRVNGCVYVVCVCVCLREREREKHMFACIDNHMCNIICCFH